MIRYALHCEHGHAFEGWFGSSDDYDAQAERGLMSCPECGSTRIEKQIMAPNVVGAKKKGEPSMRELLGRLHNHVQENFEDVGDDFAEEARAIHEGRAEGRLIHGQANYQDVVDLIESGAPIAPLPPKPPRKGDLN